MDEDALPPDPEQDRARELLAVADRRSQLQKLYDRARRAERKLTLPRVVALCLLFTLNAVWGAFAVAQHSTRAALGPDDGAFEGVFGSLLMMICGALALVFIIHARESARRDRLVLETLLDHEAAGAH